MRENSSLNWSFDYFLCRFRSIGVYSDWTSSLHLRHSFICVLSNNFHFLGSRFWKSIDIYNTMDIMKLVRHKYKPQFFHNM